MTRGEDIRKILKNPKSIDWTAETNEAFENCKNQILSTPTLQLVDPTAPFILKPDSSETIIAGALFQPFQLTPGGKTRLHPVAFHSRKLSDTEVKWHIIEKETLAIVEPLRIRDKYFHYGTAQVKVLTDSNPAKAILKMKKPKPKHFRWLLDLQQMNISYEHIAGKLNFFPDALTRIDHINCMHFVFQETVITPDIINILDTALEDTYAEFNVSESPNAPISTPGLELASALPKIKDLYESDSLAKEILSGSQDGELASYRIIDDYIFHWPKHATKPRSLYVPNDVKLRNAIMSLYHGSIYSLHSDTKRSLLKVKNHFYWPTIAEDVKQFVASCQQCIRGKYRTALSPAIHIPSEITPYPWCIIGMDAKTGLPSTKYLQNDIFWLFVDYFTGMVHVIPCRRSGMTAHKLARIFLHEIYRHHGMPLRIISDRDPLL